MHLVTADPVGLDLAVTAHVGPDGGLFIAHADGSISRHDEDYALVSIWLNPAKRVSCMTVLDNDLFVAFDDSTSRVYSLKTGLVIEEMKLPFKLTGVAVFERILVGWSKFHLDICLLHRLNFDRFQTLCAESFVVNAFSVSGQISVVTSSSVWWLKEANGVWKLTKIYKLSADDILAACCFRKGWFLAQQGVWKLMSYDESSETLTEDMAGNTPVDTVVISASSTSTAVVVQCTHHKYIIIQQNNVQVLTSPACATFEENHPCGSGLDLLPDILVTNSAKLVKPDLRMYEAVAINNGELQWQDRKLTLSLSRQRFLAGQDSPSISAIYESKESGLKYTGKDTGYINEALVFPSPVLFIDERRACCRDFEISLPLEDINMVHPISPRLYDRRVTTKIRDFEKNTPWVGISDMDSVYVSCVSQRQRSVVVAILLVLAKRHSLEKLLDEVSFSSSAISELEGLVILATERKDIPLLKISTEFLERLWGSERLDNLLKAEGPYSLKILAAVSPCIGLDKRQVSRKLQRLMLSEDNQSCDAVLWIFENCDNVLDNLRLPFASLSPISDGRLLKFVQRIVLRPGGIDRSLRDVSDLFAEQDNGPLLRVHAQELQALRFLNVTLNLEQPFELIYSEAQLIRLVEVVVNFGLRNSKESKSMLKRLVESQCIQFHQEKQLVLLPTYHSKTQAGYVYEMTNGTKTSRIALQWPAIPSDLSVESLVLGFGGDGKQVNGVFGKRKYAWPLQRSFKTIFSLNKDIIQPVML